MCAWGSLAGVTGAWLSAWVNGWWGGLVAELVDAVCRRWWQMRGCGEVRCKATTTTTTTCDAERHQHQSLVHKTCYFGQCRTPETVGAAALHD